MLGIAMGSSRAAGYVDIEGKITGWLNGWRLPVDYNPAPVDGGQATAVRATLYFSQQLLLFRLAPRVGITTCPTERPDGKS